MFLKTARKVKGYIEAEARGFTPERFINLAIRNGIKLWDVKRQTSHVIFKAYASDFFILHGFARKTGMKLKITKKYGCPFFLNRYKKRYAFICGGAVFALMLLFMSSFIWLIEVDGNVSISDSRILYVLSEHGLKIGAFRYPLNTDELENCLKKEIDGISWLRIKIDGTRASVTVAEQTESGTEDTSEKPYTACDIISDKQAVITDIIANTGSPAVKPGDVVNEGDLLISGDVTYLSDGEEVPFGRVYASGTVKGRVKRSFAYTMPYTVNMKRYTQKKRTYYNIKIFNSNFNTNFLKNDVSFEKYDIIREIKQLGLGDKFVLPVIIEKVSLREYLSERLDISPEEAKKLAAAGINRQIIEQYPTEYDIISKNVTFTQDKSSITARADITAIESLGRESFTAPINTEGGNTLNGAGENTDTQ